MALTWLRNKVAAKGMRGTTEVCLGSGYVADAVALCRLHNVFFKRYYNHSHLTPITGCGRWDKATGKLVYEWTGDIQNYFACLFEAKISRADFLSTFNNGEKQKNRHQPIGSLHWCVTPKGLIDPAELPDFWGLLEPYGAGLTEKKLPLINKLTEAELDKIAHQLIWPLQAERNYITCQTCGRWICKGYCGRCFIRSPRGRAE